MVQYTANGDPIISTVSRDYSDLPEGYNYNQLSDEHLYNYRHGHGVNAEIMFSISGQSLDDYCGDNEELKEIITRDQTRRAEFYRQQQEAREEHYRQMEQMPLGLKIILCVIGIPVCLLFLGALLSGVS